MNRIASLEQFCHKIGIFSTNPASSSITLGPYGQLLLAQIKHEWLRANLYKFESNFLVKNLNLMDSKSNVFDGDYYIRSLTNVFGHAKLPIGLINVFDSKEDSKNNKLEFKPILNKELNFFTRHSSNMCLNSFHFYDTDSVEMSFVDPLAFWQRERKNWWMKLLRNPENVSFGLNEKDAFSDENNLYYNLNFGDTNGKEKDSTHKNWLENIKHFDDLEHNRDLLKSLNIIDKKSLLSKSKQIIITQTNCQNVLETILYDSVEFPPVQEKKPILSFKKEKKKTVFNLDYRLAPFKACILFQSSLKNVQKNSNNINDLKKNLNLNDNLDSIAINLKKLFVLNQINVVLMNVAKESDIESKYDSLDEMGVPYVVYLPSTIVKDGICFIRSRDTTLLEKAHLSLVVKQFSSISNALHF